MKLMVKGGVKRWIPDVFTGYYRDLGYTVEGEETPSHDPEAGNSKAGALRKRRAPALHADGAAPLFNGGGFRAGERASGTNLRIAGCAEAVHQLPHLLFGTDAVGLGENSLLFCFGKGLEAFHGRFVLRQRHAEAQG